MSAQPYFRPCRLAPARCGASSTEWIILVCGIAMVCLIAVTVFGRKVNLLTRAGSRSLDEGAPKGAARPGVADLTGEFRPDFNDLSGGSAALGPTTGPLGTRLDHSSDYVGNPATDPTSNQSLAQVLNAGPAGTPLANFPATITLPGAFDAQNAALFASGTAAQVGTAPPVTLEQGAIIVRQADGTYVMRPGNNTPPNAQPGSWMPNYASAGAGETVVGFTHAHPPGAHPAGFLPHGFSSADLRIGTMGAHDGPDAGGSTISQGVAMMQIGNTTYAAFPSASTPSPPPTAAQLDTAFWAAHNEAIAGGASADGALLAANIAMAERAGLALYYGRSGEPLNRVH